MAVYSFINKSKAKELNYAIKGAVENVASKHGMTVQVGSVKFGSDNLTAKIVMSRVNAKGEVLTPMRNAFMSRAYLFGLKASDFGRTFTDNQGKSYKITGLKPQAKVYPILAVCTSDGKTYKFPASIVKLYLTDESDKTVS